MVFGKVNYDVQYIIHVPASNISVHCNYDAANIGLILPF